MFDHARGLQEFLFLASNADSRESKRRLGNAWCVHFGAQAAPNTPAAVKKTFGYHLRHILHCMAKMGLHLCRAFRRLRPTFFRVLYAQAETHAITNKLSKSY